MCVCVCVCVHYEKCTSLRRVAHYKKCTGPCILFRVACVHYPYCAGQCTEKVEKRDRVCKTSEGYSNKNQRSVSLFLISSTKTAPLKKQNIKCLHMNKCLCRLG